MRWNPFTMWWEHRRNNRALIECVKQIGLDIRQLREEAMEHRTLVGKELNELKYGRPFSRSTLESPLTPEQEEIVKEFSENKNLPEQIRRHFARGGKFDRGGSIGMRAALGRFGEAPSEQLRSADLVNPAVYAYDPDAPTTRVDVTISVDPSAPPDMNYEDLRRKIAAMPLSQKLRRDTYLDIPPASLEEVGLTMDEMIREDDAERDREAWDQADLDEMDDTKPKE